MTYNTLTTLSFKLYKDTNIDINEDIISTLLFEVDYLYSYIIKSSLEEDKIVLTVKFTVSENPTHNTISCKNMGNNILELLISDIPTNKVLKYEQPNLNIIFQVYNKFIAKIAKQQALMWHLEYEDVYQICALSIIKLYNKNYFLNKYLVEKTCRNDILYHIRKNINKPIIESLDKNIRNDNTEDIKYGDLIEDESSRYEFEQSVNNDAIFKMFNEVKQIIINRFGERKFEKLYRDYTNNHTDSISLTMMQKVKVYLKERNITWKSLEGEEYEH